MVTFSTRLCKLFTIYITSNRYHFVLLIVHILINLNQIVVLLSDKYLKSLMQLFFINNLYLRFKERLQFANKDTYLRKLKYCRLNYS